MKTQTMALIALRPFLHGYKVLSVGEELVTTPGHAKQLLRLGHARIGAVPEPIVSVEAALGAGAGDGATTQDVAPHADPVTMGADRIAVDLGDVAGTPAIVDGAPAVSAEPASDTGVAAVGAGSSSGGDADGTPLQAPQSMQADAGAGDGDLLSAAATGAAGPESPGPAAEDGADAEAKAATRSRRRAS
ncbi:hypothetical protein [Achromobacter denitrificans]|uniref:hypothetical protein n=1 Tax=Achromobacter denitrificans TaxID=32002 RepID=UPI000B491AA6|nr:hypothetical protein [Achromobacter denitrificans]